jgi:hypothetical protein
MPPGWAEAVAGIERGLAELVSLRIDHARLMEKVTEVVCERERLRADLGHIKVWAVHTEVELGVLRADLAAAVKRAEGAEARLAQIPARYRYENPLKTEAKS